MLPHPFKTDTLVEGERSNNANLCNEIPIGDKTYACTLEGPNFWEVFMSLSLNKKTQIKAELYKRGGGPEGKIIQSFFSGAGPNELLDQQLVERFTDALIEYDGRDITEVTDTVGELISYQLNESTQLVASFAILENFKKAGLLSQMTKEVQAVVDANVDYEKIKADVTGAVFGEGHYLTNNFKENYNMQDLSQKRGELALVNASTDPEKSQLGEATLEKLTQGVDYDVSQATIDSTKHKMTVKDYLDGKRRVKRKKSKAKSNHLPNMKNARTKAALGAVILTRLGQVQQDTQDSLKRSLLKELPLADFVELASGEKIPDYQANLLNAMQAKADPSAPIVERINTSRELFQGATDLERLPEETDEWRALGEADVGRGLTKSVIQVSDDDPGLTNEERQAIFEKHLDDALEKYISPELFPEELTEEKRVEIVQLLRAHFIDQNKSIDRQTIVTEAMGILHPLETITV